MHLYCLAVLAGFHSYGGTVFDFRSKGPWFDPRPEHRDFIRVPEQIYDIGLGDPQ